MNGMPRRLCQHTTHDFCRSLVFSASASRLELRFLALLSRTECQAHLRSFSNCLTTAARCQYMFAVITQCLKEKHKRRVDFGQGLALARRGLT